METGSKTVCSSDTIHLRENRRVHWALNLEEVLYFTPETESKNVQSLMKKLKIKTRILKNISSAFCDRDIVRKLYYMDELPALWKEFQPDTATMR